MNKTNKERLTKRTAFASTLENNLFDKLNALSRETCIPKTRLLDQAVSLLLNMHKES